jgi:hypothetical protein
MLALQILTIQVGEGFNNFWITKYNATAEAKEVNTTLSE